LGERVDDEEVAHRRGDSITRSPTCRPRPREQTQTPQ
jgi:hypothetical protein